MPDQSTTHTLSLLQCPNCDEAAVRPGRTRRDNGHISVDFECASCRFSWTSMRPGRGRWNPAPEPAPRPATAPAPAPLLDKAG